MASSRSDGIDPIASCGRPALPLTVISSAPGRESRLRSAPRSRRGQALDVGARVIGRNDATPLARPAARIGIDRCSKVLEPETIADIRPPVRAGDDDDPSSLQHVHDVPEQAADVVGLRAAKFRTRPDARADPSRAGRRSTRHGGCTRAGRPARGSASAAGTGPRTASRDGGSSALPRPSARAGRAHALVPCDDRARDPRRSCVLWASRRAPVSSASQPARAWPTMSVPLNCEPTNGQCDAIGLSPNSERGRRRRRASARSGRRGSLHPCGKRTAADPPFKLFRVHVLGSDKMARPGASNPAYRWEWSPRYGATEIFDIAAVRRDLIQARTQADRVTECVRHAWVMPTHILGCDLDRQDVTVVLGCRRDRELVRPNHTAYGQMTLSRQLALRRGRRIGSRHARCRASRRAGHAALSSGVSSTPARTRSDIRRRSCSFIHPQPWRSRPRRTSAQINSGLETLVRIAQ